MQIAIVGTGAIGSVFAYQLARAGHAATVVARGARLEQLQRDHAIVLASGEQAAVQVDAALDASTPYDLVLVTVLAPQVASVLPALRASAARTVMFMFNTFDPLDPLREAVGAQRVAFGFPAGVFAILRDGKISPQIRGGTTVGDARWAKVFTDAGIPTVVEEDMHSWLRSHAALVIPLMAIGTVSLARGDISWRESGAYADAMETAFGIVRDLGNALTPSMVRSVSRLPRSMARATLWAFSRTKASRDLGVLGPAEARMLIDMMTAAAPGKTAALLAIRP
jgi:2-dehydropantoate 2-reductase